MTNIYQRINSAMKEVQYIKKDATVQGYKAVTHDNVVAQVRETLIKNGILVLPSQVSGKLHDKTMKMGKDGKEYVDPMRMYEAEYRIRFQSIDEKDDYHDIIIQAHALDNSDKAPGKTLSYSTKYAMLKVLMIETGENDESRTGESSFYTDSQKDQFDELMEKSGDVMDIGFEMFVFSTSVGPDVFSSLYNSFEKGKITSGKKACNDLISRGVEKAQNIADEIKVLIANEDPAVGEIVVELSTDEKRLVVPHLEQSDIEYLRSIK